MRQPVKRGEGRHIYFTADTLERLETYLVINFGTHRALSMIVQKAVNDYLDKIGFNGGNPADFGAGGYGRIRERE